MSRSVGQFVHGDGKRIEVRFQSAEPRFGLCLTV
jgi:hypothetical protein